MKRLARLLQAGQRLVPPARSGTAVLAYHLVGARTDAVVDITLDEFRTQLDWLSEHCEVVSLERGLEPYAGARRRVVLTFDDAYRNFLELAWPELRARKLPATLYAPVGFVRGTAPAPLRGAGLPALSFDELRELVAAGLTVGSHSVRHVNLRRLSLAEVERELADSRAELEQELATPVDSFCYPQAKLSRAVAGLAARHYRSAVSAGGMPFTGGSPHVVPRFPVQRGQRFFEDMVSSRLWLSEALAHRVRQLRA